MKSFTFSQLLLLQRIDDALRLERLKDTDNLHFVTLLLRRKRRITERLKRPLTAYALARN